MAAVADWQMDSSENSTPASTGAAASAANPQPNHSTAQHNRLYHQPSSASPSSPSPSSSAHHPPPWQPSPQAAPFYPTYPPFFAHPAAASPSPYFDPNQHFAQWAYQQMMFNAQAQAQAQAQFHHAQAAVVAAQAQLLAQPGTRSATPPQQHQQHQQPLPDHFPRSTEPFQPYPRRPQQRQHSFPNQQSSSSSSSSSTSPTLQQPDIPNHHYPGVPAPNPPYARVDAAGSSSSLNSGSSGRSRKGSNASSANNNNSSSTNNGNNNTNVTHGRTVSSTSRTSTNSVERPPSVRSISHTSANSDAARRPAKPSPLSQPVTNAAIAASASASAAAASSPSRNSFSSTVRAESPPTPKSATAFSPTITGQQDSSTAAPSSSSPTTSPSSRPTHHKRLSISKDDSQLGEPTPVPSASMVRSGGLKGRLRRALSFNATSTLEGSSSDKQTEDEKDTKLNSRRKALANANKNNNASSSSSSSSPLPASSSSSNNNSNNSSGKGVSRFAAGLPDEDAPPSTPISDSPQESSKSSSRPRRSLFNSRINASTDNISLSSTVSSASVMIRKLGSLSVGKLARKNSLMSITSLFKDKKGNNTNGSGSASQASVTHATAEVDRMGVDGLSPAAEIVRQHTLKVKKSEEAAAARKKAEEDRVRQQQQQAHQQGAAAGAEDGVTVWERGTTNKKGKRIGEYVYDEDDDDEANNQYQLYRDPADSGSDNDSDGTHSGHGHGQRDIERISRGWQDLDLDDDEDVTIRVNQHPQIHSQSSGMNTQNSQIMLPITEQDDETWAVGLRRSLERKKRPTKSILKNADHTQENILIQMQNPSTAAAPVPLVRYRSNSYNHGSINEPGPLAKIPDPDPDHIDGLQHHRDKTGVLNGDHHHLPAFTFEDALPHNIPPRSSSPGNVSINSTGHGVFNLPVNSSAPVLSTFASHSTNATTTIRPPKGSQKKLAFAANLSIYDTFSAAVYDRRSEPATCNRLTPALAQRIKEELNSYKMEEMEVHALSRGHTQFFV